MLQVFIFMSFYFIFSTPLNLLIQQWDFEPMQWDFGPTQWDFGPNLSIPTATTALTPENTNLPCKGPIVFVDIICNEGSICHHFESEVNLFYGIFERISQIHCLEDLHTYVQASIDPAFLISQLTRLSQKQ